jgi:hypothetical protein
MVRVRTVPETTSLRTAHLPRGAWTSAADGASDPFACRHQGRCRARQLGAQRSAFCGSRDGAISQHWGPGNAWSKAGVLGICFPSAPAMVVLSASGHLYTLPAAGGPPWQAISLQASAASLNVPATIICRGV